MKNVHKFIAVLACFLVTVSCADGAHKILSSKNRDNIDPDRDLTRQDFVDMHNAEAYKKAGEPQVSANVMEPPIPNLAEILAAPKPPKLGETKLVSVAVTDDVPLKDVLIELARLADVDIEVDSGITGGISFRAKDRPFNEVIERIADLAGLRYTMKNNVLRVERDLPYIQIYSLDLLNIDRSATGNIGVSSTGSSTGTGAAAIGGSSSSSGSSGSSSTTSGSGTAGSSSTVTATSTSDFWAQFKDSIDRILLYQESTMLSGASVASQPAQSAGLPSAPGGASPSAPAAPIPTPAAAPASGAGNVSSSAPFASLNRTAGTLTVFATEHKQEIIRRFINAIVANSSAQVLIEAKIVEVELNDHYQTGINWTKFGLPSVKLSGNLGGAVKPDNTSLEPATITLLKNNIFGNNLDINAAVNLLDEFGTTRALSSPRLNAVNNQQAVLSFVENVLYFKIDCKVTDAVPAASGSTVGTPAHVDVTSTPETAPVGIVLVLQPSINKDSNEITLSVRPTLTKITKFVDDPGFAVCKAQAAAQLTDSSQADILKTLNGTTSAYPQVESREMDSILKIKTGQVMIIGGLLEDKIVNTDSGVPGVGEVPYLGNLFKSTDKVNTKKELVILIRATITSPNGYMDKADKDIYQKFMQDPRPIDFPPASP